jgi:hypothetical protein
MRPLDIYRSFTPYRSNHHIHRADRRAILASRDPEAAAWSLGNQRQREALSDKLWALFCERGTDRPVDQNDVFRVVDLIGHEPDPDTQWPLIVKLLRKAKDRQLRYSEYEKVSLDILVQLNALGDDFRWW